MARDTHLMHGLAVRSDLPLHHGRRTTAAPDLDLRSGLDRPVPDDAPPGVTMAALHTDDRPLYTLTRHGDGYVLRFHRTCDVVLSGDLRRARLHIDPTADRGLAPVVVTGLLVASVLVLRGHLVLHASAVERDGRAVAFVARSGHGKSTLATLAVASGARFVTDDVLRVDVAGGRALARLGATESRLRRTSTEVWDGAADGSTRRTADGRSAVSVPLAQDDPLPLAAVVLPFASRSATSLRLTRLTASEALLGLSACPRVLGWCDPRTRGEQFTSLARLATCVPVLQAVVPWGPPFDAAVVRELLDQVVAGEPRQDARRPVLR